MGFQINVSSSVSNEYGANVYAFAVKQDYSVTDDLANLITFYQINKLSLTQLGGHIEPNIAGETIEVEGTIPGDNVYDSLDTNTPHTIPHAFVDYSVYVVAENDLGLISIQSAGRHNGYSIVSVADLALNQVVTFTDADPDNKLVANIDGVVSSGNVMHYSVLAFSDPNVTEEEAHYYADKRLEPGIYGTTTVPFVAITDLNVTNVVGNLDHANPENSVLYDIHDVNAGKLFVILKDVGASGSELDGVGANHYGVQTSNIDIHGASQLAHARVKQVRTEGNYLKVDVSGFSAFSVPERFAITVVPHGNPAPANDFTTTIPPSNITGGELSNVYEHTFSIDSYDLSKEYDVYVRLDTSEMAFKSPNAYMLANLQDPLVLSPTSATRTFSPDPSANVSGLTFSGDFVSVMGTVTLNAHPYVPDATSVDVVLSVSADHPAITAITTTTHSNRFTTAGPHSFGLNTTIEGYAVANVSRVYVHVLVTTNSSDYLYQEVQSLVDNVLERNQDDLFVTFGDSEFNYGNLETTIHSVFNASSAPLSEMYVVVTPHGYLDSSVTGQINEDTPGTSRVSFTPTINPGQLIDLSSTVFLFTEAYNAPVLEHYIDVRVESGKYVFFPSVTEFVKGHTYIFDNRANHGAVGDLSKHPLNFDYTDGVSPYDFTPDADGFTTVTVPLDAAYTELFAYCENHAGMGDTVNNGATGIQVTDPATSGVALVSTEVYYVNVVSASQGVYHGPLFEPNASGVRAMTVGFDATSGNVEVSSIEIKTLAPAEETLKFVGYTYALVSKTAVYNANVEAVVSVDLSGISTSGVATLDGPVVLDKVIDAVNADVHPATSTRNVYVYGWIENTTTNAKTSVFTVSHLNNLLYPYITEVEYDTNQLVVRPGKLSVMETGGANVDSFYLMAFDSAVSLVAGFDYAPFMTPTNIITDTDVVSDDIYVNTADLFVSKMYTSAIDPSLTAGIRPGQTVNVVLVATSTDRENKAFVKPYTVPSDVAGILGEFAPMFSVDKTKLVFMSGGKARGPGKVRVAIFRSPQEDPITAAGVNYKESGSDAASNGFNFLSTMFDGVSLDKTVDDVPLVNVNRVYVYAWVHNSVGTTNSAVADAAPKHSSGTQYYTKINSVSHAEDVVTTVTIQTGVFAFAQSITTYYVGVFEKGYAALLDDADIKTKLMATYGVDIPVVRYATGVNRYGFESQSSILTKALTSGGAVEPIGNGEYLVYLLATNVSEGVEELSPAYTYAINVPGVTAIENLAFNRTTNQVTFSVKARGFSEGNAAVVHAVAYTYANVAPSVGTNYLVGAGSFTVDSGSVDTPVTNLAIGTVIAKDGTLHTPNEVNEVHVYVWLVQGVVESVLYSGAILATASPYPVLSNVQIVDTTGASGTLTVFDDASGYYVGLFRADTVATTKPVDFLYDFFDTMTIVDFPVTDGNVASVQLSGITTAYTDLANPALTNAIDATKQYNLIVIALLAGGQFTMAKTANLTVTTTSTGGEDPVAANPATVANFGIEYNAADDTADIQQVDLVVPTGVSGPFTFYALAVTSPVTTVTAQRLNNTARVTLASGITSSVLGFSLANAFPKVVDAIGNVVDFKSVRTAHAYAWGVNTATGEVGPIEIAANGFDNNGIAGPVPRVLSVGVDATEMSLTVESATVFSSNLDVDKYVIFAMKDVGQSEADVKAFAVTHLYTGTTMTPGKSAFGELKDFTPDNLEDNVYTVPGYSVVITQAFTSTASPGGTETLTTGTSYRVYMAATDTGNVTTLYTYPNTLKLEGYGEWVLVNRDVYTLLKPSTIQNVGTVDDVNDFEASYSILGDLKNGTGDMTDALVKTDGNYKFRLIPYLDGEPRLAANNTTTFIEWTQTSNPTTTTDSVSGFANYTYAEPNAASYTFVHSTTAPFDGLKIKSTSTSNAWLNGQSDPTKWYYAVGAKNTNGDGFPFAMGTTYANVTKAELYVWKSLDAPPGLATVGAIKNVLFDNSVQNYHTVSFGLESVTASSVEDSEVYAALFTRDLKYEKHADDLGGYKNAVFAAESKISPILEVPAGTSVNASQIMPSKGPYQLWLYMLRHDQGSEQSGNPGLVDHNYVNSIFMYDTPDAWPGSGGIETENGNRLEYTVDFVADLDNRPPDTFASWNALLKDPFHNGKAFKSNSESETVPIIKLGNIDSSVKSVYIAWYRPIYAFDFKFELRDAFGKVVSSYEDRTKSDLSGLSDTTSIASQMNAAHGKWNIPEFTETPNPIVLDKAIDTNGDLVDLYTVNTGYLYVWAKTLGSSAGDFAGGRSAIQGVVGTTTVPTFDRSVYTTANDALTQTLITTAIFDRDTPTNMYPVSSHRLSNPTGYDASSGVYGYVNEYILMTFKDGIDGSQFTKITQNFNRTRSEYALEYYENYDGTYDEANWKTYATLQVPNAETTPYPIWASWDNITQGSTIIAKTDKNP